MQQMGDELGKAGDLRRRAETLFQARFADTLEDPGTMTPHRVRNLIHQLQVHQIELEMQNEELRRAQVELGEARARYFDLYNLAPLGYCTLDSEGLILEANLTLANLLGSVRGEVVQQPITRFILAEDQDLYYLHRKQVLQSSAQKACELRMVRQGGTFFWAHLDFSADADGESESRVVISDISERKRAEKEKEEIELQLQRSQNLESLGRLAGGVAHDMNNVLAAIMGMASALREGHPDPDHRARSLDTIIRACTRGRDVVKSLLYFARKDLEAVAQVVAAGPAVKPTSPEPTCTEPF